jgi:hypothetical protein
VPTKDCGTIFVTTAATTATAAATGMAAAVGRGCCGGGGRRAVERQPGRPGRSGHRHGPGPYPPRCCR